VANPGDVGKNHMLAELNEWLVAALNSVVGRSFLLDTVLALPLRNELVKAAPVLACLMAAWQGSRIQEKLQRRRILVVTMLAALTAAGLSRLISESNALPRPYVFQKRVYALGSDGLVEQGIQRFRTPRDNASQERVERLDAAQIPPNDFGSFPSDHAALFFTLSLGIWLAWRPAGVVAMAWTCGAILLPKLWVGMHSPLDVLGGCLLGAIVLGVLVAIQRHAVDGLARRATHLTLRYEAFATAMVFLYAFEASATFDHVAELGKGVARHLLH
jgi:membrane-associated phospholipid phosphatase